MIYNRKDLIMKENKYMLQLNDTKCDFGKFVLEYNKTLIDEM